MIRLMCKLPREIYVAVSGGVDSMAALDFLKRNHKVTVAFFNHANDLSNKEQQFVEKYCCENSIEIKTAYVSSEKLTNQSWEEYWRIQRYAFFDTLQHPVITAHHLDDAMETWVWSSANGLPKLPLMQRGNVLRPFLTTPKSNLVQWAVKHRVPWIEDPTNVDTNFVRNLIRHELMPIFLKVNPGFEKVIYKKLAEISVDNQTKLQ